MTQEIAATVPSEPGWYAVCRSDSMGTHAVRVSRWGMVLLLPPTVTTLEPVVAPCRVANVGNDRLVPLDLKGTRLDERPSFIGLQTPNEDTETAVRRIDAARVVA